ncbi:hypothetical protein [Leptolyngbya sp. FACHB-261]|uniref:hypothetical protein n=1 Tax=Leptolyngbya sp. FACHB-261 TaxID=2692806 RepID=UPI001683CFD9|nr:hypothetical protein [Leptolyngbya sp. FACHB-261]MBD2101862.1 hypothetical protein [Leptolyngbya sp. FACHB-261]
MPSQVSGTSASTEPSFDVTIFKGNNHRPKYVASCLSQHVPSLPANQVSSILACISRSGKATIHLGSDPLVIRSCIQGLSATELKYSLTNTL